MNNKNESNKITKQQNEYGLQMVPLAYVEMIETRHAKERRLWIWAFVIAIALFVFLWLQYDYVSTAEYSGAYVMVDSQGNVIESDLSPDDVIRILTELNGNSKNN